MKTLPCKMCFRLSSNPLCSARPKTPHNHPIRPPLITCMLSSFYPVMPLWLTPLCAHKSYIPFSTCLCPELSRTLLHPLLAFPHRLRWSPIKQIPHSSLHALPIPIRLLIHQLVKRPEDRAHRRYMFLRKPFHETRRRQPRRNHRRVNAINRNINRRGARRQRARQAPSACFAAEYCGVAGRAYRPAAEAVTTILPPGTGFSAA